MKRQNEKQDEYEKREKREKQGTGNKSMARLVARLGTGHTFGTRLGTGSGLGTGRRLAEKPGTEKLWTGHVLGTGHRLMNRPGKGRRLGTGYIARWARNVAIVSLVISVVGCSNMIRRGQSPDDQMMKLADDATKTKYVSDACRIYGLNFAKIEGIGLVTNVIGTGSNPTPSGQRDRLLSELKSRSIENAKSLIASEDTSMVVLQGLLPPGIKKGERFDVEVKTLPKSDTTSLEHGYLVETRMRPMALMGRGVKTGHITGYAKGNVLVNSVFESRKDQSNQTTGWIFGGGVAAEDRSIGLTLRTDQSIRATTSIARAINSRFTKIQGTERKGVATPKNDTIVDLIIPNEYRHNIGRYLQVVMNIAIDENDLQRVNRLDRLDHQMADPANCRETAVRLEALGKQAIPALKRALRHHDMEVKFHAAQALAYLGESDGIDVLEQAAREEPDFRWHALTALATSEDFAASAALANLMQVESAETRYGAFRALRARSPQDPLVQGTAMDDFFFHVVPSEADPMLHFSRSQRPEAVCFGEDQTVSNDFLYVESGLTIRADGDETIRVARYDRNGEQRKTCSTKIPELIRTLSEIGVDYSTMLQMFREAKQKGYLNTRLVVNAVPQIVRNGKASTVGDVALEKPEKYVAGPVPDLFRPGDDGESATNESPAEELDAEIAADNLDEMATKKTDKNRGKNAGETESRWSKMKGWFTGD